MKQYKIYSLHQFISDKKPNQCLSILKSDSWSDPIVVEKNARFIEHELVIIDLVISKNDLTIEEKELLVDRILFVANMYKNKFVLQITQYTISKLLLSKIDNRHFLELYSKILNYCHENSIEAFTYKHLYNLVLQIWAEHPKTISTEFRTKLLKIGLNNKLPSNILAHIKNDLDIWFVNLDKNQTISMIIKELCAIDPTGELLNLKKSFEQRVEKIKEYKKAFHKFHNMCPEEYELKLANAKSKGLCKDVREGKVCSNNHCAFYHGKLEETFGIQYCRNSDCEHLKNGICRFLHRPTKEQLANANKLYSLLNRAENCYFADHDQIPFIDDLRKTNPFFVLEKVITNDFGAIYGVPTCCTMVNEYFISNKTCSGSKMEIEIPVISENKIRCGRSVTIMTSDDNFYCSFEHMRMSNNNCNYVVKQNIFRSSDDGKSQQNGQA